MARAPSTATAGRSPGRASWRGSPRAALRVGRDRVPARVARRRPAAARPRPPAPRPSRSTRCRSAARTRAPCCWRCSARRTSRRGARCTSSTTTTCRRTPSPGPGAARPMLRIKGTTKALVATTDANAPVGAHRPVARGRDVGRRGGPQRLDHRRPAARRHELPQLRRPDPARGVLAADRGRPRACRTRAWRSACRSPAATSRCTTSRPRRRSPRPPRSASSGCSTTSRSASGRRSAPTATQVLLVGRGRRRPRGQRVRAARRRRRPTTARRRSTSRSRRALQAFIREAVDRGLVESCQDVSGGGLAVALAEMAMWGGRGAQVRLALGGSPAVGLFGESPSRLVCEVAPRHVPAFILLARQHGLPGDELGTTGGSRLVIELAGEGATGAAEERGSRVADALDVSIDDLRHAWDHGLPRALGWEAAATDASGRPDVRRRRRRPARSRPRGGGRRRDRAVRPPAPRPGVGRRRRLRRPQPDDLQGPGHGQPGARRAADPVAHRRPRRRALPVLDHRLDGLGERPADAPPRAAPGARHRPQRQPRQHPRAARPARRRARPPRREHRHRAPDRAPRRRAGGQHGRRPDQGAAAGPRRVQPRDPRRGPGHRRARPARLPPARPRATARTTATAPTAPGCGATTRPAGSSPRRPPPSTSSARSTSGTSSPARSSSSSPVASRSRSATPRPRPPCACSSSSTSPGPTRTWRGATCTRRGGTWGCSWRSSTPSRPTS